MANLKLIMNKYQNLEDLILSQWPSQLDGHLHYCVGLSGGIDSVVLLYLLKSLMSQQNFTLSAIHVNHGISLNSNQWEDFCANLCQKLSIPLSISRLLVTKEPGQGLENSARKLRYKEFAAMKEKVIVTAHHQDDQVETMLSQLMRGSALHNIAGMRPINVKQKQLFWRPLLNINKQQLLNYAALHQISNIEDESNLDNNYLRNFLRNQIIPQLKQYDADITVKLNKSLDSIQKSAKLLDEIATSDLNQCLAGDKISLAQFKTLSALRQLNLLAYFIKTSNLPLPSNKQLAEFNHQVCHAKIDRHPKLWLSEHYAIIRHSKYILISTL